MNIIKKMTITCLLLAGLFFASHGYAEQKIQSGPVTAELIAEHQTIQPGTPFWVAIRLNMEDSWHSYWKNPGDAGIPPTISWELPEGFTASDMLWPTPNRYDTQSLIGYGYEKEVLLLVQITPPETIAANSDATLKAKLDWLVCSDMSCLPGSGEVSISLPVVQEAPQQHQDKETIANALQSLPKSVWGTLNAERKNGLIELTVTPPDHAVTVSNAYFAPSNNDQIDHTVEAIVTKDNASGNAYTVAFRDNCSNCDKAKKLDGVLVLMNGDNVVEAVDIVLPITDAASDSSYISMADGNGANNTIAPADEGVGSVLIFYLATAFVGGLILNLMPCVLPVVSFKILSFVKLAGKDRSLTLKHGAAFALGVLVSFWSLAGVLLTLKASGSAVGWGFQLQEPLFVAIMAAVIFIFSMSMFGVLEIGTVFASWAGTKHAQGKKRENLTGSFFSGVLATAVATPCTGPFLGPAVGFAVTQPAIAAMAVFTSLGLGMAMPYLILAAFPSLLRFMPKPGNWMITFKEATGFIMLATVMWLLWVFGAQTNNFAIFMLLAGLFFLGLSCWIYGKWATPVKKKIVRTIGTTVATAVLIVGGHFIYTASSPSVVSLDDPQPLSMHAHSKTGQWEDFSPERVAELQAQGIPVFVDFTARWCLICQANHLVLSVDHVDKKMDQLGVVKMKADWTKRDAIITEELAKFGRNGVPLYVLYGPNPAEEPKVLPQVLTPETVIDALHEIESKQLAKNEK